MKLPYFTACAQPSLEALLPLVCCHVLQILIYNTKNYSLHDSPCWCSYISLITDTHFTKSWQICQIIEVHFGFGYGWFNTEGNQVRESSEYVFSRGSKIKKFFSPPLTASQSSREKEMMKMTHELLQSLKIRQLLFYIWKGRLVCSVAIFLPFLFLKIFKQGGI